MSQIYHDLPNRAQLPTIWKGVISRAPLNPQARVSVSVVDMNSDLNFENVRWQARDAMSLPEIGDECIIAFDNNREPWVVTWWPSTKNPSLHTGKFVDGAPPNPVAGDLWIAEDVNATCKQLIFIYNNGAWEPISLIPMPIQDNKWLKGVNGRIEWTLITAGDITGGGAEGWWGGNGSPASITGDIGDWYLNYLNGDVYEKTGLATWTLRTNIRGPQGIQGPQGATGATGSTGPPGPAGATYTLPARIEAGAAGNVVADANLATSSGWYTLPQTAANGPRALDWLLEVIAWRYDFATQIAHYFYGQEMWRRVINGGYWTAWEKIYPVDAFPASGFTVGGDTSLYRAAAATLQTPGALTTGAATLTTGNSAGAGTYQGPGGTFASVRSGYGFSFTAARLGDTGTYRYMVDVDGKINWGDGTIASPDTNLYRVQGGILGTDGQIYFRGSASYLAFYQVADTAARFYIGPGGNLNWGPGSATQDTNIYRIAPAILQTDGELRAGALNMKADGGKLYFGPSYDTSLYRLGANVLYTSGRFLVAGDIAANLNSANQIWMSSDGRLYWGSASDTSLYRTGANSLETGNLNVTGTFEAGSGRLGKVAKYPDGGDWNNALDNGWYMYANGVNAPNALGGWFIGQVIAHGATGWRIQRLTDFTAPAGSPVYERRQLNGTWGAWVPIDGTALPASGITFGGDTNLYRSAAGVLKTDSFLNVQGAFSVAYGRATTRVGGTDQIVVGDRSGDGATAQITFGSAGDTNLYRSAAGTLKTDGSLIVAGNLTVTGTLTSSSSGASAPAGAIMQYAGSAVPTGWLLADGTAVSRATYSALFAAIGTAYGTGDGSSTFNLPNMKGRVPVGYDAGNANFNALGKTGGTATQTMSAAEMPSHSHGVNDPGHAHNMHVWNYSGPNGVNYHPTGEDGQNYQRGAVGGDIDPASTGISIQATGGNAAQNNLQPYISVNYIIKT